MAEPKPVRPSFSKAANDDNPSRHVISDAEKKRALDPPLDNSVVEKLHDVEVSDPFRPLEKIEAPETLEWIKRQNAKFEDYIRETSITSEGMPARHGDKYFVWGVQPGSEHWSFYVKDSELPGTPARLLLDPLKIDPAGKTGIANTSISPDGKILSYALSKSGSDETTMKFMDIATGEDLPLSYPKFRSGIIWDDDSQGFRYSRPKEGLDKTFEVMHHKLGDDTAADTVIYSPDKAETRAHVSIPKKDGTDAPGDYEFLSISNTTPNRNALLVRPRGGTEEFKEIFPHKDGTLIPLTQIGGEVYAITSHGASRKKLVAVDPNDPAPEKWRTILPEDKQDLLQDVFVLKDKIFATYSHDTGQIVKVFDLQGQHLHDVPLPPLSTISRGRVNHDDTSFLLSINNFQETGNIYRYDVASNKLETFKESPQMSDLKDAIVERLYATSKDGTKVPFTVIRGKDTKLDGTAATLLYGYGGFNIPLSAGYSGDIASWVRAGGIYVQSNLRGGGEFGQEWYDGGRLGNKQNVFDDFAAIAEELIAKKYTKPERLAIEGGSNGGLLTLATVIQRPELFGAVISKVPVTDMNRFHLDSFYGYGWKSDYGDPGIKEDFNNAAKYSPLHNVKQGFKHPPILIQTDANDDRVRPWHSYKMAATLQAKEDPNSMTFLQVNNDGGHSGGASAAAQRKKAGAVRAFLRKVLGPIDQNVYKATLAKAPKKPAGPAPKTGT